MPARDNPRDQGAVNRDREFEELLSKAAQRAEADRERILKAEQAEPLAGKKRASAA